MPISQGSNWMYDTAADAAYSIDNSVLLDGQYSDGSIAQTGGDRKTHTLSLWHKRAPWGPGTGSGEMDATTNDLWGTDSEGDTLRFNGSRLAFFQNGGDGGQLYTTAVFRDYSAWYHFVIAVDTTQAVAANRLKMYVNGAQQTVFDTAVYPDEDAEFKLMESSQDFNIGMGHSATYNAQGYYADFIIVDGAAKAASDFGEFNDDGIWVPKEYTGDFNTGSGTNGGHYKFAGAAEGTGAGATGIDSSGNSNTINFRNQVGGLTDSPTNNFCTLNPAWVYGNAITTGPTRGNLRVEGGSWAGAKATMGVNKGKWYWEYTSDNANTIIGIQTDSGDQLTGNAHNILSTCGLYLDGEVWIKDSTSGRNDTDVTQTFADDEVYGIALNMDDNQISFYQDGTLITNGGSIALDGLADKYVFPFHANYNSIVLYNFGNPVFAIASGNADENGYGNFEHAPPSGYYALCTKNLAEYG